MSGQLMVPQMGIADRIDFAVEHGKDKALELLFGAPYQAANAFVYALEKDDLIHGLGDRHRVWAWLARIADRCRNAADPTDFITEMENARSILKRNLVGQPA